MQSEHIQTAIETPELPATAPEGYEFVEGPRNDWDAKIYPGDNPTFHEALLERHPDALLVRHGVDGVTVPGYYNAYAPAPEEIEPATGMFARVRHLLGRKAAQ